MPADQGSGGAHVELRDVSKSFGGVRALQGVSLAIARGSIHALVGENGAGKSTLGKIIAGATAPDHGQMLLDGAPVRFHSPHDAIARGVVLIAQEMAIVPALSVAENVVLGAEPRRAGFVDRRELRRRYAQLADSVGFELRGDQRAAGLRTADQQKVEILRALGRDAGLIVMDEPTAALAAPDVARLHEVVRRLAASGATVVLVSHFLREVLDLADQVTVLRDGRVVLDAPAAEQSEDTLLSAMLGRSLGAAFPPKRPPGPGAPVVLSTAGVVAPGVDGVSLQVRAGEIVGLAGLVGAGRTELARALSGASPISAGSVSVAGQVRLAGGRPLGGRRRGSPGSALRSGIAMIPESRKDSGLMAGRPVAENVSLSSLRSLSRIGFVARRAERDAVGGVLRQVAASGPAQSAPVAALSGGNQQKVLFARMLLRRPRALIADEPTRGVDVGAKRAIYDLLVSLAADGLGVLLISSDMEEILGLAHRALVMRGGRIAAELADGDMTEAAILTAAFGAAERGAQ